MLNEKDLNPQKADESIDLAGAKLSGARHLGTIGSRWQFPSDHTPAIVNVSIAGVSIQSASWNVLNSAFMKYIETDEQGLAGSLITELHKPSQDALTERDLAVADTIDELLEGGTSLLCLQECSAGLVEELRRRLAKRSQSSAESGYKLLSSREPPGRDQGLILYDAHILQLSEDDPVRVSHYGQGQKYILDAVFALREQADVELRMICTHVPGGPGGPDGRARLGDYLDLAVARDTPAIVCGDMNVSYEEMCDLMGERTRGAYRGVAPNRYTHVSTKQEAVVFDYFLYNGAGRSDFQIQTHPSPEELSERLAGALELLHGERK